MTPSTWSGAFAAVLGPALLFVYFWSEAAFGPSQPDGGALRMAVGFTLVTGALLCFVVALLRLNARASSRDSRMARLGTQLGHAAVGLLLIGSALWWPILFLWRDFGPVAGAAVGLGALSLFGAWPLLGLRAARQHALPRWVRPLPLALFALFLLVLYVTGTARPWPLIVAVFVPFALGWVFVAYGIWRPAMPDARSPTPDRRVG